MSLLEQALQALQAARTRALNTLARAVVRLVDDGKKLQAMQVGALADEDIDDAERFQQYGFSSVPTPGAEAVVLFPGGDRAHPLVIAVDDRRYRPTGRSPGETILYTKEGDEIQLANGHIIRLKTTGKVEIGAEGVSLVPQNGVATGMTLDSWGGPLFVGGVSTVVFAKKT